MGKIHDKNVKEEPRPSPHDSIHHSLLAAAFSFVKPATPAMPVQNNHD
jgi:hypothetical protein